MYIICAFVLAESPNREALRFLDAESGKPGLPAYTKGSVIFLLQTEQLLYGIRDAEGFLGDGIHRDPECAGFDDDFPV